MKRFTKAWILAFFLGPGVLAGCGGSEKAAAEEDDEIELDD